MADLIATETPYGSIELVDAFDDSGEIIEIPQSALSQREVIDLLQQEFAFNIDLSNTRYET